MSNIPEFIFIVPYRDRAAQLSIFLSHMPYLLEGMNYEVYFAHQQDKRFFNRGAMKDIGFIHAKKKYPNHYKDINFVFHDVDTFLSKKGMTDFKTTKGMVKHVLGFKRTFGGIFVMKGSDFENMNGFPCIWNWGMEDNALKLRWLTKKRQGKDKKIDYSQFYHVNSKGVILLWHGDQKVFNKHEAWNAYEKSTDFKDGINKIRNIVKTEVNMDLHSNFESEKGKWKMLNITNFIPATLPPKTAQRKEIKSVRDAHFGWEKRVQPRNRHYQIRKSFSMLGGR